MPCPGAKPSDRCRARLLSWKSQTRVGKHDVMESIAEDLPHVGFGFGLPELPMVVSWRLPPRCWVGGLLLANVYNRSPTHSPSTQLSQQSLRTLKFQKPKPPQANPSPQKPPRLPGHDSTSIPRPREASVRRVPSSQGWVTAARRPFQTSTWGLGCRVQRMSYS